MSQTPALCGSGIEVVSDTYEARRINVQIKLAVNVGIKIKIEAAEEVC